MKKITILIVDADKASAMLLEELVQMTYKESADIQILNTSNGKEAINFCNKYKIELVLTEVHLKDMDGWELTRKIKGLYPSIPIIIQTAIVMDDTKQMFRKSGANSFIAKPINIHEMQKNIHSALCSG